MTSPTRTRTIALTALAMLAFAANSLLCRKALGGQAIDPASFTLVRLASGALMLWLVVSVRGKAAPGAPTDWIAAAMLFLYAVTFSFAYITLSAGTGALLLFGMVQLTMFVVGLRDGERFPGVSWAALAAAIAGLVLLVSPGVTAPEPAGALLMAVAGIAWGVYSLRGRGVANPLGATARNFALAVPMGVATSLLFVERFHVEPAGLVLAVASGAIASAIGYVIWYAALSGLRATHAATVQLSVPAITALGGAVLLAEPITLRLLLASVVILGGIAVVLTRRDPAR